MPWTTISPFPRIPSGTGLTGRLPMTNAATSATRSSMSATRIISERDGRGLRQANQG